MTTKPPRYYRPYGVGVFPLSYTARERTVLELQAKRDRRHIPPQWYWRLLTPDEPGGGHGLSDEYFEQPLALRQYAPPVAAHLFVDDTSEQKGINRGRADTDGTALIEMSRAECLRLGVVYGIASDVDGTGEGLYIPQSGDLFMHLSVHFMVHQMTDMEHFGPTEIVGIWKGTASQVKDDSVASIFAARPEMIPATTIPPQPVGSQEIRWPG